MPKTDAMKPMSALHNFSLVACVLITLTSCARTSNASGDVFLTTKTADVKRGAGTPICLAESNAATLSEWQVIRDDLIKRAITGGSDVLAHHDLFRSTFNAAQEARFQRNLKEPTTFAERLNLAEANMTASRDTQQRLTALKKQIDQKQHDWDRHTAAVYEALEGLGRRCTRAVVTDVNGHYTFAEVAGGPVLLVGKLPIRAAKIYWVISLMIADKDQKVDLTNANAVFGVEQDEVQTAIRPL